jgi:hypothetical protein
VVRALGYRSGGPGSIPGTTIKKAVGLKRGPLSLVSTTEELLDRRVAAPVQKQYLIETEEQTDTPTHTCAYSYENTYTPCVCTMFINILGLK